MSGARAQAESAGWSASPIAPELASVLLGTLGLVATIEWHLHEFRKCTRIPCELTVNDAAGFNLPEEYATAIFHVYLEALSNVARHAAASRVAIEVSMTPDEVAMVVRDDGIGIASVQDRSSNLGGLAGVCKRADSYNGMCRISGAPNSGTTLSVRLPLGEAACRKEYSAYAR